MTLGDFDDEPEESGYRAPLPRDDRLWRHPSELTDAAPTGVKTGVKTDEGSSFPWLRRRFLRRD